MYKALNSNSSFSSYIGDNFFNRCLYNEGYNYIFDDIINSLFCWSEPLILCLSCFILLLLLPVMFLTNGEKNDNGKASRLYNTSKLTIMTFFHRITYIYLIFFPLAVFIGQPQPCIALNFDSSFSKLFFFPATPLACNLITLFFLSSIFSRKSVIYRCILNVLVIFLCFHYICIGRISISQSIITLFIAYTLHFISQHLTFMFSFIEFAVILVFFIVFICIKWNFILEVKQYVSHILITSVALYFIDIYIRSRFYYTRKGLVSIGKPIDLEYEKVSEKSYFTNIAPEDPETFHRNMQKDLLDSAIAMLIFILSLFIRNIFSSIYKISEYGLM